jgi:cystathionine beta-lyase
MTTEYDFTTLPKRQNTGSLKWDRFGQKDILPMWVADMDLLTAPEILSALHGRLEHGVFGYTIPYDSVTAAVLEYLQTRHGFKTTADSLCWLPGLVPALNLCCHAFTEPDEAILTCTPVYPPFLTAPENARRQLISVPLLRHEQNWALDFDALEQAVTPKTRLFFLCHPHNPVGHVYSEAELQQLSEFCERHNLLIVSDEIHCDLIFAPAVKHRVTATLSDSLAQRTVTLMSPSKTYNLPGLACAYAVIPNPRLRTRFRRTIQGIITEINAFGYVGCEAAYRYGEPWRQALLAHLRGNYELLQNTLREHLPAITLHPMQATYLAWLDVSAYQIKQPCAHFEAHGVGLSDGNAFGDHRFLRLNFGCPRQMLETALNRMVQAITDI